MKKASVIFILALCILLMAGCSGGEKGQHGDEEGIMNIDFGEKGMIRNGTAYETYQVEEGQQGIVSVRISRDSGRIDLDIYPTNRPEDAQYTGRKLDSASFEVILSQPGEYKVRVTAEDFIGDYGISWRTEDAGKGAK